MGKTGASLYTDVDKRVRELQLELDRVSHSNNPQMNSSALRVVPQRYPKGTLRLELERQLELLLREQVRSLTSVTSISNNLTVFARLTL